MSSNRHQRQWDPEVTMNLVHCLTGNVSCVGQARTCGRRCKRRIGRPRILAAYEILYTLADWDPLAAAALPDLLKAIDLLLCYQHGDQRSEVAEQWRVYLKHEELRRMRKEGSEPEDKQRSERKKGQRRQHEAEQKREREDKRKQKEKERQGKEKGGQKRQNQEEERRQQEEKKRHEQEEKMRRDKEERQRQKQERDRREQEAREWSKREKDQREQEARKRSQGEKKSDTRQSRSPGWEGYLAQWRIIEAQEDKKKKLSYKQLPCPTKSGVWEDVTEKEVHSFFKEAAKIHMPKQQNESLYQLMCRETKRWHTDKLLSRFGQEVFMSPYKFALDVITKEVVAIWKRAKVQRSL